MKADILARKLLNYRNEDGEYDEVFVKDNKLIVGWANGEKNYILLENNISKHKEIKKDKVDKILYIAEYYDEIGNIKRDIHNFSAEIINELKK